MGLCHFIVAGERSLMRKVARSKADSIRTAGIIGTCRDNWEAHTAAGWAACVFIWIFAIAFGYSWGPSKSQAFLDTFILILS